MDHVHDIIEFNYSQDPEEDFAKEKDNEESFASMMSLYNAHYEMEHPTTATAAATAETNISWKDRFERLMEADGRKPDCSAMIDGITVMVTYTKLLARRDQDRIQMFSEIVRARVQMQCSTTRIFRNSSD